MLFFKRILDFKKDRDVPADNRQAPRHAVGPTFPFKAVVTLPAYDGEGKRIENNNTGTNWTGRLTNLSATGGSIQLSAASVGKRGEPCHFRLSLDTYVLDIPAKVGYFREYPGYNHCGFAYSFSNFETQKAYLQVLEPVAIGSSFIAVNPKSVLQDIPGLHKEQFSGHSGSVLTIWRQATSKEIHGFDLRMKSFGVRWSQGLPALDIYGYIQPPTPPGRKAVAPPLEFHKLSEAPREEVQWLFCLAVPNLAKAVPADVRKFLGNLVAT